MDNEFKSKQIKEFLSRIDIEVHWTKPNNHTGNADVERLHSTILEKITGVDDKSLSVEAKIQLVVGYYNDRYHSTIRTSPRKAKEEIEESKLSRLVEKAK